MTHTTPPGEAPNLGLELVARGKVRDIYELDSHLLFVTSDRMSAFDVVMAEPIPNKGRVLNAMTAYWMRELTDIVPNHEAAEGTFELPEAAGHPHYLGRLAVVRKAEMLPIECIVRANLTGSVVKEYAALGTVHGMPAPSGLEISQAFPEPIFTPSTKAEQGDNDENISFDEAVNKVGREAAELARDISLRLFQRIYQQAREKGIIIADTKFELGWIDGQLALCDEVATPDSSRFWEEDQVALGETPPSFDKQPVRDYLVDLGWNKLPPPPPLPPEVVRATSLRYVAGYERITGKRLSDWPGEHVVLGP